MESYIVKIRSIRKITHDVLQLETDKPSQISFTPGQATEISINKGGWRNKTRPFTFTSLPGDDHLQFTIKTYPARKGVTNELLTLKVNDELILNDVFGTIAYKGEGTFIAGGAGITPFISILRFLRNEHKTGNNRLIFANKTLDDIILKEELSDILGNSFINILSDQHVEGFPYGFITTSFLEENIADLNKNIYLCGPPRMMTLVEKMLAELNVDETMIIKEAF